MRDAKQPYSPSSTKLVPIENISKGGTTYHLARHTFATLALSKGVPIESVSKMLVHTNIRTTQLYAKIVDQKKIDAVNLVDKVFD